MKNSYIYGLRDPRNWEIFYVGQTVKPNIRLDQHIYLKGQFHNWPKAKRVKEILACGLKPKMEILQVCPSWAWKDKERGFIKQFRELGIPLTNIASGGESFPPGKKCSPEAVAYRASKIRGFRHTEDAKARIRESNLRTWSNPELVARHREFGRAGAKKQWADMSEEERKGKIERLHAGITPESNAKRRGVPSPQKGRKRTAEQIQRNREAQIARWNSRTEEEKKKITLNMLKAREMREYK